MKVFSQVFTPTNNRRLNELVGFLLLVSALLLFLAIASYSPLDPSSNTASAPLASRPSRNWIGIVGAYGSDLSLQFAGIAAFLMPVFLGLLGTFWGLIETVGSVGKVIDGLKVGGHQASSASLAAIMTALYFHVLRPQDRVALKDVRAGFAKAMERFILHRTGAALPRAS